MIALAVFIGMGFLIFVWNNWPDLLERIGFFLIAQADSLRARAKRYGELKLKGI